MNKRLKKLLTILPLFAAGIATPIALTSCGSTSSISPDVEKPDVGNPKVGKVTFEAEQTITNARKTDTQNKPETIKVLDPNVNANAQKIAQNTFKTKLTKENLQIDMDEVLFKFFKTYEFENETETPGGNDIELEAEVQKIEVVDINEDLNANLNVTFKVTKKIDKDSDEEGDKEEETVTITEVVQPKTLKLTPRFATTTEIKSITQMLQKADKNEQDGNDSKYEADLDDLIKLYIGDKDDNEKSIFEQVGILTEESKYGGLLGYGIQIADLAYDPDYKNPEGKNLKLKANRITGGETIFAPSAVITEFYVPNDSVTTADGTEITIDYEKVSQYTKEEVLSIEKVYDETPEQTPAQPANGGSGSGGSDSSTLPDGTSKKPILNNILVTPIEKKDGVEVSVKIEKDSSNQAAQNFLLVDITFKTTPNGTETEQRLANITKVRISIDGNWLKTTPTVSPEVGKVFFEAKQSNKTRTGTSNTPTTPDKPTTLEVLDPNVNADAQKIAQNTFKTKLTKENLQTDMDQVLFKFFKTYEFESETNDLNGTQSEVEAEVQKIEVVDIESNLNAKLKVTYKVETEVDTKDNETTKFVDQEKTLKLTPRFATTTEIQSITQMLQNADKNNQDGNDLQYEADLDELIKLYIGDKEDDEKSIFGQVGLLTKESKYGGLLGYGIKISDLAYTPKNSNLKLKANRITGDETIFAPSAVITDFYVPNDSVTTADGIDITIDYTKVSQHTKEEVLKITKAYEETPTEPTTPPTDGGSGSGGSTPSTFTGEVSKELFLNDILVTPIKKKDNVKVSVKIQEDSANEAAQNFLSVDITFETTPTEAETEEGLANITVVRISIDGNWLKTTTTASPQTK